MSTTPSPCIRRVVLAGRYAVRRKLGSGSVGTVYLAFDELERREVALKVIRTEALIARPRDRIQEEFRAIAALDHPQIARAYDFGYTEGDGVPFYTREYVAGRPLPPGPPSGEPPEEFLRPLLDLLEALEYLHEQGVLHLDIHAGNLIVADDSRRGSVLIDFGLAPSPGAVARSGAAASWAAMPPELLAGGPQGPATDLYLAGRLLVYRLTGRLAGEPALPREIPGWGARRTLELERIAQKALQADPRKRFGSASELRAALSRALGCALKRRHGAEPRGMLLGREAEIDEIEGALGAANEGRPAVLLFCGSAGLGKSRLLEEARLRSQLRGLDTVAVRFSSEPDPRAALPRALRGRKRRRQRRLEWLEALEPRCGGSTAERAQRAAAAYFLEGERPLVLVLDDLELAGKESSLLVEALAAECRRRSTGGIQGRGLAMVLATGRVSRPAVAGITAHRLRPLREAAARRLFLALVRPLSPPEPLVRAAVSTSGGSPLLLRQIARAVRDEWRESRVIPATAELPTVAFGSEGFGEWERLHADDRRVLAALAVFRRPAVLDELAAAAELPLAPTARSLRRLTAFEVVSGRGRGRVRRFRLAHPELAPELVKRLPRREVRRLHEKAVSLLSGRPRPSLVERECLARHLLALERRREGVRLAIDAARCLRASGFRDRAVTLLEHAEPMARAMRTRLELIELLSAMLDESGDHQRGIAILEPLSSGSPSRLARRDRVRVGRRLGVHFHRAGLPERALAIFDATRRIADPARDIEDVIHIESEVAELEIFRGNLSAAEEACRRGLAHLEGLRGDEDFRGRMEVMLRASLGHIELRRLRFAEARTELRRALALCRRFGTAGDRAAILLNLGVTDNETNDFAGARRRLEEAERVLARAGEGQDLSKVSTNLALIAAKLGDRAQAELHLERAASLLRHFPVRRLECFAAYSRGLVRQLFGECEEALDSLEDAIHRARALGDSTMEAFAGVHASEAAMLAGRYGKALGFLRAASAADCGEMPILRRMVASRLYLVEALLGRRRRAAEALERLEAAPRSDVFYLETWNDLFLGLGRVAAGEPAAELFERCLEAFEGFGAVHGARLSRLGILSASLRAGERDRVRDLVRRIEASRETCHRFLQVAEPVALAEGHFALGDLEAARERLSVASSAIVGSPFVEVDWRLELLKAKTAAGRGDVTEARRHLHRALHCRNLLVELVPHRARKSFLEHPRFRPLRDAERRLGFSVVREPSTESLRRSRGLDAMVGRSAPMVSLFQTIERLREQEVPVLIAGETGTGKELVARAIHRRSPRRDRPFRVIQCACLPPELFESELFGHVAGAFTGAERDQPGLLEDASGGTVLLDDVHLLPLECQSKLLGFADAKTIRKVGSETSTPIDVRLLATTTADLRRAAAAGSFQEALYFRLAGVELRVPPLRERRDDIRLLARHFLERHAMRLDRPVPSLDEEAALLLERHDWPGNVRELETLLFRAMITLSPPERISARDLELLLQKEERRTAPAGRGLLLRGLDEWRRDLERDYISELFHELRGDVPAMARALGVRRTKLYDWCRRLGIDLREMRRRLPRRGT